MKLLKDDSLNRCVDKFTASLPDFISVEASLIGDYSGLLTDSELARTTRYCEKRMREYSTGRAVAKSLLRKINAFSGELIKLASGEACFPPELVGSITHCDKFCLCAAGDKRNVKALGIDVEKITSFTAQEALVFMPLEEYRQIAALSETRNEMLTAAFSIREAAYKCLFPIYGRRFSLTDVMIDVGSLPSKEPAISLSGLSQAPKLQSRLVCISGYVFTAAYIEDA